MAAVLFRQGAVGHTLINAQAFRHLRRQTITSYLGWLVCDTLMTCAPFTSSHSGIYNSQLMTKVVLTMRLTRLKHINIPPVIPT